MHVVVRYFNLLDFGQFAEYQAGGEAALGVGAHFGEVFVLAFAHEVQVSGHIKALLLQHSFPLGAYRINFAFVKQWRGVDDGDLADGGEAFLLQFVAGGGFGLGRKVCHYGSAQGREIVITFAQGSGEFVVQFRHVFFLDGQNGYLEINIPSGEGGSGIVIGDAQRKCQFVILGRAQQIGGKAGERQDAILGGNVFHVLFVDYGVLAHSSLDIDIEAVAVLNGAFYGFPHYLLFLHSLEGAVNLFVGYGDRLLGQADGAIVAQVNAGFQGDGGRKGDDGVDLRDFDAGFRKGGHGLVGEGLAEGFRHHKVQRFLYQGDASDHVFHDMAGSAAAAEAGDVDAADGAAVGPLKVRVFVLGGHFHRQRDLNG